jgi:Zn-dependent protease with chaperone function
MTTLEGHYFDGLKPICVTAGIDFSGGEATLSAGSLTERYAIPDLRVSPRIGSTGRFITLPNGGQFLCADHSFLDSLPQESRSEGPVAWLEERWYVALACIAIVFSTLAAGYFFGLPAAAKRIVAHIPIQAEQPLGSKALAWLDAKGWLKPTGLPFDTRMVIRDGFEGLCRDLPARNCYRLEFRSSAVFGPNALALPGGIVVLTDEMVKAAVSREEVLAVLAHEIGHVELRHTLRSVLQNSVIGAAAAMVTSDAASLSLAVAGLPVLFARTKYSRQFEAEADEYGFGLLRQKGYSPAAFASVMERLGKKDMKQMGAFTYLSSHPMTAERVKRARAAAAEQETKTVPDDKQGKE